MQPTERFLELPAQEAVDPNAAIDAVEFDDLDTILMPALSPANEPSAPRHESAASEFEVELEAEEIDALLAGHWGRN